MRKTTIILIFILTVFKNALWSQANPGVKFLGFKQTECANTRDYRSGSFNCGSHLYGYQIFKGSNFIYTSSCGKGFGYRGAYSADYLKFINDSTGFLRETTTSESPTIITIKKTTDFGKSWEVIASDFSAHSPYNSFSEYFVLNTEEIVTVYSPIITMYGHVVIDGILDSVDVDTTIYLSKVGNSDCINDTLEFNVEWSGEIVTYTLIIDYKPLGINVTEQNDISIYPNPVSDNVYIKNYKKVKTLEIFDVSGEKIKEINNLISDEINLSDLKKGIYLFQIHTVGNKIQMKIVKN